MCEAHGSILLGHDADLKTYICRTDHYFLPSIKFDISNHIKSCVQCQLRKCSSLKKCPFKLCLLRICTTTGYMSTFLDLSKCLNKEKSTSCVLQTHLQNTLKWGPFQTKKLLLWLNPLWTIWSAVLDPQCKSIRMEENNLWTNFQLNYSTSSTLNIPKLPRSTLRPMLKWNCSTKQWLNI